MILYALILISRAYVTSSVSISSTNAGAGYTYSECVAEGEKQVNGYYLENPNYSLTTKNFRYSPSGEKREVDSPIQPKYLHIPGKFYNYACVAQPDRK